MTLTRKLWLLAFTLYALFAVTTFLLVNAYWYAGLYFIAYVVIWFKLKKRLKTNT